MEAIEILGREHAVIRAFLDALAKAARDIGRGEGPPPEFFERALWFCRTCADKAHHYKEEHVMFGRLAEKHDGKLDAQIERHRQQHEHCRNVVQAMSESLPGYARGEPEAARSLRDNLDLYVMTLRKHIVSEDEVFFPMAEVFLTEQEGKALLDEFRKYEKLAGADPMVEGQQALAEMEGML